MQPSELCWTVRHDMVGARSTVLSQLWLYNNSRLRRNLPNYQM